MVLRLTFEVVSAYAVCLSVFLLASVNGDHCLIISEVNADNPKLDTTEFVELYHTGGLRASLDGYTLVFYNGNGNVAYKVLDLKGHTTDDRGFFLVGSVDMQPKPAIPLPPNTVQNGPDAIALYRTSAARYTEKMNATAVGLVDAIVYMTRRSGGVEVLAETLTPGEPAFVEDEGVHEGDESIERCLVSGESWGFQVALPSPGQRNRCTPPGPSATSMHISEVKLGGGQTDGFVELSQYQAAGPLVLLVLDGRTDTVSESVDVQLTRGDLISITIDKNKMKGAGAIAMYNGRASDFPVGSPLSRTQPLDAFVFAGPGDQPSANLTETLIPGRQPFQLSSRFGDGGLYLSRCGVASWTRDPGVFWEAPQTPGQPNQCPWPKICTNSSVVPGSTDVPPHLPPWSRGDFLISEVNADNPGLAEDAEFIELWHPSGRRVSLQAVWLLLFSGHNSKPYREISLTGQFTTAQGYFLVGSDRLVPAPSVRLPSNTIQNGPDAVALYRSPSGPPSTSQKGIPTQGLLDAVVYRVRGSDKDAQELSDALTPGQLPLLEDPEVQPGDEALSRCNNLLPADLSAFVVAPPTPLRENSCPRPPPPPENVVISEVGGARWTNHSQQRGFVELLGPILTSLQGLVLTVFEEHRAGTTMALPLTGSTDHNGFYLIGNVTGADQLFPEGATIPANGAVVLCSDTVTVCRAGTTLTNSTLRDTLVFSDDIKLLSKLSATIGQEVMPVIRSVDNGPVSLSRCSCCVARSPSSWTSSSPTPRLTNICPSPAFSSDIDLCLRPKATDWHPANCSGLVQGSSEVDVAIYLEERCHCGISALYLQVTNLSCVAGLLRVQGNIQALSNHQMTLILQTSPNQGKTCTAPNNNRDISTESAIHMQIGLVLGTLVLLGLAAGLFTYLYKKRCSA
ncbi:hypothetical protein UPYG_G00140000 [Umbra pygmaea]|uniref:LTD domain-containing protein n=1 Tax=Umbra pygmaea TaxID=75934 RepID=A0ABD0XBH5_UMBPY